MRNSARSIPYERLISYAAGELSDDEIAEIEAHLAVSPESAATVARYQAASRALQAGRMIEPSHETLDRAKQLFRSHASTPASRRSGARETLRRIVAELVFDSRVSPAVSGVRGPGDAILVRYESSEIDVEIDLQIEAVTGAGAPDPPQWRVLGQVGMDDAPPALPIRLLRAGTNEPIVETATDDHGVFSFHAMTGRYDLQAQFPEGLLTLPELELG